MNAQMEGTTSGTSFPPGQAIHTQIRIFSKEKEQTVSFLSLKILLPLMYLNLSPLTQKCAF